MLCVYLQTFEAALFLEEEEESSCFALLVLNNIIICNIIIIIIIMVIFKCYFSGELIALSLKKIYITKNKNNKNGVNMELGKTNRLKALCMMQIKK